MSDLLVASRFRGPDGGCRLVAGPGTAAFGYWRSLLGHSPGLGECPSQQHVHVGVDAAELVVGPADQGVVDGWIDAKQDLAALAHVYSEPTFTTGDGG